jgi:SPP1 family predicted phage head-tail adaptor
MESGKLRHKIILQRPVDTRDALGGITQSWEDWLTIRAEILPLAAREQWQAQQIAAETDARIRIRYRPGIDARVRVKHLRASGSPQLFDYYDLTGDPIDVGGRKKELHLMCVRRSAEGFRTGDPT